MKNFICKSCGEKHDFYTTVEFGLPKEILVGLDSGDLKYESSERWFIIDNNFFLIKCLLAIPINNYKSDYNWLMWVLVGKDVFLDFIESLKIPQNMNGFKGEGVLFAEHAYFDKILGTKVLVKANSIESFPHLIILDKDLKLREFMENGVSLEKAVDIMTSLYHMV